MRVWLFAFLAAWAAAARLKAAGDRALLWQPPWTYEQSAGADALPTGTGFERRREGDGYVLSYTFRDFNDALLTLKTRVRAADLKASDEEYGYTQKELEEIHRRYGKLGARVYEQRLRDYLAGRGFRMLGGDVVQADIPWLVRKNAPRLNPAARSLDLVASSRGYGPEEIVGAATAMVQTAVRFQVPSTVEEGRHTGGVHPPVRALVDGWGDCDTKSALLASLLQNWDGMKAVGLALPRHYLMGIARIPRKADAYIEHEGAPYVLIEPAGPAWLPPGALARETLDQLDAMPGVPIQPF